MSQPVRLAAAQRERASRPASEQARSSRQASQPAGRPAESRRNGRFIYLGGGWREKRINHKAAHRQINESQISRWQKQRFTYLVSILARMEQSRRVAVWSSFCVCVWFGLVASWRASRRPACTGRRCVCLLAAACRRASVGTHTHIVACGGDLLARRVAVGQCERRQARRRTTCCSGRSPLARPLAT